MIYDPSTGKQIFRDLERVTATPHISPAAAYEAWANELGLSPTQSLGGMLNADDGSVDVQLGFSPAIDGTTDILMQSTEGSIGVYVDPPQGNTSNTSRPITKVLPEQQNVTRAYTTRSAVNPSFIINCKHPTNDSRSEATKWQKNATDAIFYITWRSYGATTKYTYLAVRFGVGTIELVASCDDTAGAYLQMFLMDSTSASGAALPGSGNYATAMQHGEIYHFKTGTPKYITGVVTDDSGSALATKIRAYKRVDGSFSAETTSDAITGAYTLEVTEGVFYVVCMNDAENKNALIFDKVIPVD